MAEPRRPAPSGRALTREQRTELHRLLHVIPVGTERHDERIVAFVRAWYRIHVPASVAGHAIISLRVTRGAPAELLESLKTALDDPALRIKPQPNCDCDRCDEMRGGQ